MCAKRLRKKAEKLLQNITDWKERADPVIPDISAVTVAPRTNGIALNGHARLHSASPAKSPSPGKVIPIVQPSSKKPRHDGSFADSPAIVRSAEGMVAFLRLDQELDRWTNANAPRLANGAADDIQQLEQQLRRYLTASDDEFDGGVSLYTMDGAVGEKRKL